LKTRGREDRVFDYPLRRLARRVFAESLMDTTGEFLGDGAAGEDEMTRADKEGS
jgi:hypothetical protein